MRCFCVRTYQPFKFHAAHLAGEIMEMLNAPAEFSVSHNSLDRLGSARRRYMLLAGGIVFEQLGLESFEPETPDEEAGPSRLAPRVGNAVEAVVAVARLWCIGRCRICTTYDADRKASRYVAG